MIALIVAFGALWAARIALFVAWFGTVGAAACAVWVALEDLENRRNARCR